MNYKGGKTDRSYSEVGDTLRYFNSVSSSKSWCGSGGHLHPLDPAAAAAAVATSPGARTGFLFGFRAGGGGKESAKKRMARAKKARSNSSSSHLLSLAHNANATTPQQLNALVAAATAAAAAANSPPTVVAPPRNNSYGGTPHFETIQDSVLETVDRNNLLTLCDASAGVTTTGSVPGVKRGATAAPGAASEAGASSGKSSRRSSSLVSPLAALGAVKRQISRSAPHSHKNSREVISIVLHPPDDEEEDEEENGDQDDAPPPDDCGASGKKKRKKKKGESLLLRTVTGRRSTSLDYEDDRYGAAAAASATSLVFDRFWVASEEDREILNQLVDPRDQAMQVEEALRRRSMVQITSNPFQTSPVKGASRSARASLTGLASSSALSPRRHSEFARDRGASIGGVPSPTVSSERVSTAPSGIEEEAEGADGARRKSSSTDGNVLAGGSDGENIEASETGAAVAVAIPAHVLSAFRRQSTVSRRSRLRTWRNRMCKRVIPRRLLTAVLDESDLESDTSSHGGDHNSSDESQLGLADRDLESVQRGVLARTKQKYLSMEASSLPDRLFTALLIALTSVAILVLFWFQNFGPGFHFKKH